MPTYIANEIGRWMGFGRSRAIVEGDVATVEFDRGGPSMTFRGDLAADKAIDMAYLTWVECFMSEVAGFERDEFLQLKWFIYRGYTRQQLNDLRTQGKNSHVEQVRAWQAQREEEQRKEAEMATRREQEDRARLEQLLKAQREAKEGKDREGKARRERDELRKELLNAESKLEIAAREASETGDQAARREQ